MGQLLSKAQTIAGLIVGGAIFLELVGVLSLGPLARIVELFLMAVWLFDGLAHAYTAWTTGSISQLRAWCWAPGLVVFLLLDVFALNLVVGTITFDEFPRWGEWTFSERLQRHVDNDMPNSRSFRLAVWWAGTVNQILPGHIDIRIK